MEVVATIAWGEVEEAEMVESVVGDKRRLEEDMFNNMSMQLASQV
jgi:hypothetical protein